MKKYLTLTLILLTLFTLLLLTACMGQNPPEETDSETDGETTAEITEPATDPEAPTEDESEKDTEPISQPEDTSPDGVVMADIYPTPTEIMYEEGYVATHTVKLNEAAAGYVTLLADHGVTVAEDGLPLTVTLREMTEFT